MAQVVQATCPGCKKVLRIPTDWIHKTLRCKKCGVSLTVEGSGSRFREVAQPVTCPKCGEKNELLWPMDGGYKVTAGGVNTAEP